MKKIEEITKSCNECYLIYTYIVEYSLRNVELIRRKAKPQDSAGLNTRGRENPRDCWETATRCPILLDAHWEEIKKGVSQGNQTIPLLFSLFSIEAS